MFSAQQVRGGGVVRRIIHDTNRYASLEEVLQRVDDEGWHVVQIGDQVIVLCSTGDMRILR
ncbi:hypothetical protein [Microbacterium enclense]|uniref:hypothetical protein n=1 Tax=Microbacterium enclense TaxID=993073 RepID=UPI0034274358